LADLATSELGQLPAEPSAATPAAAAAAAAFAASAPDAAVVELLHTLATRHTPPAVQWDGRGDPKVITPLRLETRREKMALKCEWGLWEG